MTPGAKCVQILGREFGDGYEWIYCRVHEGFGGKSTFNADISKWDTGRVTNMYRFYQASEPRHWELEHSCTLTGTAVVVSTKTLGVVTDK